MLAKDIELVLIVEISRCWTRTTCSVVIPKRNRPFVRPAKFSGSGSPHNSAGRLQTQIKLLAPKFWWAKASQIGWIAYFYYHMQAGIAAVRVLYFSVSQ